MLLDDLDKRIADLEVEIKERNTDLKASSTEDKRLLLQTINTGRETLKRLLDEKNKKSFPQGNVVLF